MSTSTSNNTLNTALISVDLVVFRLKGEQLQLLTRKLQREEGGFVNVLPSGRIAPETDTDLDTTAQRLLSYLTPAKAAYMEQVVTRGNAQRDSRGWSLTVVYYALLNGDAAAFSEDAHWTILQNGKPTSSLAYDHETLVHEAFLRLQNKIQYSSLPVYLLPSLFTLSDITKVFLAVIGSAPPMRSIRNRFLQGQLLVDTGKQRRGSNRPATLYTINQSRQTYLFNRLYQYCGQFSQGGTMRRHQ